MWATLRLRVHTLVFGVVGEFRNGLEIVVIEGLHADDGPEYLLAYDAHIAVRLREDGRLDEIALVGGNVAAGDDLRALFPAGFEEAPHPLMLLLRDEWAEVHAWIETVADLDLAGFGGDAFDDAIIDRLVGEET